MCVFYGPACAISKAYSAFSGNAEAATEVFTDANSNNAVDILFTMNYFKIDPSTTERHIPTAVKFNKCFENGSVMDDANPLTLAYRTALHEGGHALGA